MLVETVIYIAIDHIDDLDTLITLLISKEITFDKVRTVIEGVFLANIDDIIIDIPSARNHLAKFQDLYLESQLPSPPIHS